MRYALPVVLGVIAVTGCEAILGLHPVQQHADSALDSAVDGAPDATPPCTDPLAYYTFDGSAMIDATGHGHDGTLGDPAPMLVASGELGSAYLFDGSATVSIDDSTAFQTPQLTVSLWIEPSDTGSNHCFINQLVRKGGTMYDNTWQLCLFDNKLGLYGSDTPDLLVGVANDNVWQHAALVMDGSNVTVWLDGSNTSAAFVPSYDSSQILIGADLDDTAIGPVAGYAGKIDELKFFSCVVPTDQLGEL